MLSPLKAKTFTPRPPSLAGSSREPSGLREEGGFQWAARPPRTPPPRHLPSIAHSLACPGDTGHLPPHLRECGVNGWRARRRWFSKAPSPSSFPSPWRKALHGTAPVLSEFLSPQAHTFSGRRSIPRHPRMGSVHGQYLQGTSGEAAATVIQTRFESQLHLLLTSWPWHIEPSLSFLLCKV